MRRQERERAELIRQYNEKCRELWCGGPRSYWDAPATPNWDPVPLLDFNLGPAGWESRRRFCDFLQGVTRPSIVLGGGRGGEFAAVIGRRREVPLSPFIRPPGFVWGAPPQRPNRVSRPVRETAAAAAAVPSSGPLPDVVGDNRDEE